MLYAMRILYMLAICIVAAESQSTAARARHVRNVNKVGCGGYNGGNGYVQSCGCNAESGVPLTRAVYEAFLADSDATIISSATCIPDFEFYEYDKILLFPALALLRNVGSGAFFGCTHPTSVVDLEDSPLEAVGAYAFNRFHGRVTLRSFPTLATIGTGAFEKASNPESYADIRMPLGGVPMSISTKAFAEFGGKLNVEGTHELAYAGSDIFTGASHPDNAFGVDCNIQPRTYSWKHSVCKVTDLIETP